MSESLRIANCSGFYGDRLSAAREMVEGGQIDVLTGDYLAELTMYLLSKSRDGGRPGYAASFLKQMDDVLGTCLDRGIKIVTNAGGLDPEGLARELRALAERRGLQVSVAHVTGDDLMPRLDDLRGQGVEFTNLDTGEPFADAQLSPVTANAYLGGRGIAEALARGADVVICPRVTDASLVVGPAMWKFGWTDTDHDQIAGAVAAGHVIECGAQATGGNYAFFDEIKDAVHPGFPIAEMYADGSSVITKHEGTAGEVSVGTVTAQLVYEVGERLYLNPDVALDLASIELDQVGPDRVRMSGVRGYAPPPTHKVSMVCSGGYRQSITFAITGLHVEEKARFAREALSDALDDFRDFDDVEFRLVRTDQPGATLNELAVAELVVTFCSNDKSTMGRRIFDAAVGIGLSNFPGLYFPGEASRTPKRVGVNWPCLVPSHHVTEVVVLDDGTQVEVAQQVHRAPVPDLEPTSIVAGPPTDKDFREVPLGMIAGARSGDKGAHANVGIWARSDRAHRWLASELTVEKFRELLPEADGLAITRVELPNLRAVNFVVHGLLGGGAASQARFDSQAKGLGEFIRSRPVRVPLSVLEEKEDA